jgi:mono/diheme cytochrome c family protein
MNVSFRGVFALLLMAAFVVSSLLAAEKTEKAKPLPPAAKRKVDFVKDIQPLLAQHCVDCHGPDDHQGYLRLDAKKIVFQGGLSGPTVKPGKSAESILVRRIAGIGHEKQMPPDGDGLSNEQIGLIRAWIDQGANWPDGVGPDITELPKHWAYVKPTRPKPPTVKNKAWVRNDIDRFVLAKLEAMRLTPSNEETKERLLRRVTLDLTGLPPTLAEIDAFVADKSEQAYEKVVDRLLKSPRYGERWAIPWLDAARYTDSNGYQRDGRRVYWAYRDWVVKALNADMPFDQFTIEQIAGDLLPEATLNQRIATGFHRGTMANVEAGTDPEEEHVLAVIDRVNTTGTVWLGTSIECGQCHEHKYDPFTQRDYYRLYAFFNNTEKEIARRGSGRDFTGPKIDLPLDAKRAAMRTSVKTEIARVEKQVAALSSELGKKQPAWEQAVATMRDDSNWTVLKAESLESAEVGGLRKLDDNSILAGGNFPGTDVYHVTAKTDLPRITAFRLEILTDPSLPAGGPGRAKPGNFILSEFRVEAADPKTPTKFKPVKLSSPIADFSQTKWPVTAAIDGNRKTGWAIAPQFGRRHHAVFRTQSPAGILKGAVLRFTLDQQYGNSRTIGRFQLLATQGDPAMLGTPMRIRELVKQPAKKRTKKQKTELGNFFLAQSKELTALKNQLKKLKTQAEKIKPITTLVMKEIAKPRVTRVFTRGDFLKPGEVVSAGVPKILNPWPKNAPDNRLGFAQWLVSNENPLVARVTVNRHWAEFFGRGIVETVEDFGSQGDAPTHPQLLDWLATGFMENGWSVKTLHKTIVMSAVYRQSSRVTPELLARDLYNLWYARGPRFRLKAEFIRDNALAIAGLLSEKMYGPPVFPFQPAGVWNHIGQASNAWTTSSGEDLHRRGLYTYWRRTVHYPSFANFDAPSREACTVKRSRSNTPLQALTLLNDPVYFEAATALATRMMTEPSTNTTIEKRIEYGFRLATGRRSVARETSILLNRYRSELARYRKTPATAKLLIGKWKMPAGADPAEFAAWIHVGNILLNLDETITKG